MPRKSLALALVAVLVFSMSFAFVLPNVLGPAKTSNSEKYAGYIQLQLYNNTNYQGQIGSYNYVFIYYPTTNVKGQTVEGSLSVYRQGIATPTAFPLTTNTSHDYYGITFAITKISDNYITVMVKAI